MCNTADREEITTFLEQAKELLSRGAFVFIPRRKSMQALAAYGLTIKDTKEEILDLKTSDYYKGPKKDFDMPGVIWEFKKVIRREKFYIKLKIETDKKTNVLKCLGFHKDDFA